MGTKYMPHDVEPKWQSRWEESQLYRSKVDWNKPKHYALTMLPYPSGDLHIGHWFAMTPSDARARFMRMRGYNVLFPMGFDAFGLPAEQAAISRNIHPWKWTYENIERMRMQLRSMGTMFDWKREAVSCTPEYYKWTEWFFKRFYEHGLAYRGEAMVNWSETLQTVLANEQVVDGKDERTGQPVIQKLMTQWFFKITKYADELLNFDLLDWPDPVKIMQTNWIGRSEGARVIFHTETGDPIEIFTTRPDTLWGATFMVLAPEHSLVKTITTQAQRDAVEAYIAQASRATEIERLSEDREKTGVFTGGYAINPVNGERIPIWIADYVMISYGTGAIMAVPAHDVRDFAFAQQFGLEIRPVIQPADAPFTAPLTEAYIGSGVMINSGDFNGTISNGEKGRKNPAISAVIDFIAAQGFGRESVNYRLRDWLISRQRYWGSPIPMVYDAEGKPHPVKDETLPVILPEDVDFRKSTRNPLMDHEPFLNAGDGLRRETDTMDTFMCSSWYQLRYLSPHYDQAPFDPEEAAYWLPVDVYTGGAEHATMHLLYTRFFTKAMRDLGMFEDAAKIMRDHARNPERLFDEPMLMLRNQGQVLGAEQSGDFVIATGRFDEHGKLWAERVEVVMPQAIPTDVPNGVAGEIMKRVEKTLFIGANKTVVEVLDEARIIIPRIGGENNVTQLRPHLEIQRMSKSKGNVVNPDELVAKYGADTVRAYLMFAFDWEKGGPWDDNQIIGVVRWLNDVWEIVQTGVSGSEYDPETQRHLERKLHQTIAKVTRNMESFKFNGAVANLMEFRNDLRAALRQGIHATAFRETIHAYLRMMAPITPHIAEELWDQMGFGYSVHQQDFPSYDAEKAREESVSLVVMVNGKPRESIQVAVDIDQITAETLALETESVKRALDGNAPKRMVFIPARGGQEPKINIVI